MEDKQTEDIREGNRCYKCFYYDRCYIKGVSRLVRTKVGFCRRNDKCVENGDSCSLFRLKKRTRRDKATLLLHLNGLLSDLRELRMLMEEEGDEENKKV